ncbi:hypothetical protein K469DRAFT_670287 [Zopfia rhizophila CBS 207.26]|uniref:DUF7143 domain-containing protein n=1 Tax=Zopfia rhizophila CBS 207.26 TaxID=1314779 RepID=A0A6A6DVB0_9PEZI|nr:hypothetical protein K469DRAFT_670287 [Zopfia rhizophila CBS 207.26]
MHTSSVSLLCFSMLVSQALSIPLFTPRQPGPCFIIGDTALPAETQEAADALASSITCDTSRKTIGNVPDVSTSTQSFSNVNFAASSSTPLQFALDSFKTSTPLSSSNLRNFQQQLDLYTATEAGIRSEGGNLSIKIPKFFLAMQVARIKTAQGIDITDPGQTVEHLVGKVLSNAKGEDHALLDQVTALGTQLD